MSQMAQEFERQLREMRMRGVRGRRSVSDDQAVSKPAMEIEPDTVAAVEAEETKMKKVTKKVVAKKAKPSQKKKRLTVKAKGKKSVKGKRSRTKREAGTSRARAIYMARRPVPDEIRTPSVARTVLEAIGASADGLDFNAIQVATGGVNANSLRFYLGKFQQAKLIKRR